MSRRIVIYLHPGGSEDGELGKAKKPAATKKPDTSPKIYTIAGTLGDNLGWYATAVSAETIRADVLKQFAELGWNVQTFGFDYYRDEKQYRFRMTALVPASYTLEQVKLLATGAFQNFYSGGRGHYFTNVRLDAAAEYVAPSPSTNSVPDQPSNNSNPYVPGYVPPAGAPFSFGQALTDLSKGLFGSFGTSTLLVAVVLGGIIVLKRSV
jgi:hypothetical protein